MTSNLADLRDVVAYLTEQGIMPRVTDLTVGTVSLSLTPEPPPEEPASPPPRVDEEEHRARRIDRARALLFGGALKDGLDV